MSLEYPSGPSAKHSVWVSQGAADSLSSQLRELPYFRALVRAMETRLYVGVELPTPVLDLGCGDASFAAQLFEPGAEGFDVGIDPSRSSLAEATDRRAHDSLLEGAGAHLPFPDASLGSIVSNSVLEHIDDLEPVIGECGRVLRPGGRFAFCVPSDRFGDLLLGTRLVGRPYRAFFQIISRHRHCDSAETWTARLERHGLCVDSVVPYCSQRTLRAVELGHYLCLPNLIHKRLRSTWVPHGNLSARVLRTLEQRLRPLMDEAPNDAGSAYLFFVAHKPS